MDELSEHLTRLIRDYVRSSSPLQQGPRMRGGGTTENIRKPTDQASMIAERLVRDGYSAGMLLDNVRVVPERFPEGNTAEAVLRLEVSMPFVFKLSSAPKLVAEASLLRRIQQRRDLPATYRARYPIVYAIKDDEPPFAYLMQYFDTQETYVGLNKLLVGAPTDPPPNARRIVDAVMDAFMEAFTATKNTRYQPNLEVDYLYRIEERMTRAAADPRFRPRPIRIDPDGQELDPWTHYVDRIRSNNAHISEMQPGFATFVHGDPNPENIMVRVTSGNIDVKFIDPKEWEVGDWLFDVTKLSHYLVATGPIEQLDADQIHAEEQGDTLVLRYDATPSHASTLAVNEIYARADEFAAENSDHAWDKRYELGLAANILGLPGNRMAKRPEVALALYAEGVRHLERCVTLLEA